MAKIKEIEGQIIHDSRGENTIQVTIRSTEGDTGTSAVPAGASKGSLEAKVVEPERGIELIANEIKKALVGKDCLDQKLIDQTLIELDGTPNKAKLGANTILGVSLATSRVAANELKQPLYQYLGALDDRQSFLLPIPMMNLINGGKHADNNLEIQEFMVVPDRISNFHNQLSAGKLIFSTLGQFLKGESAFLPTGDEGGYAPSLDTNESAMGYLVQAIRQSGYTPWEEVSLAIDVAASSLPSTFDTSPERYLNMIHDFPILSIEDPFNEEDWASWVEFKRMLEEYNASNKKLMLVGDDLFVTNPERTKMGIEKKAANAILIKLNQIGTLTETLQVIEIARQAGYIIVVSHRSGETLDDYIADFSVGVGAQFIKSGAPNDNHPERMSKYRRLLAIERELTTPKLENVSQHSS